MKKLICVVLLSLLTGCMSREEEERYAKEYTMDIIYTRDERTGICFAVSGIGSGRSITTVDCSKVPANMILSAK